MNYLGYVDTGLTDGTTYYYVVTSVDREGREGPPTPELAASPEAQLFEAAVTVQKSMVISLSEQKLYCLENGRVVYVFLVSSGAGGTPTPVGNFRILYHDEVHPVPKYPGTVCYYWMGFFEDYAIHAWPMVNGVQTNYEGLGYPASHGCVRLDPTKAHIPYYWAPDGTPLSIIPGPFQAPPMPIRGGHVSRGTAASHTDWYFAEGYTGGGFDEYILVFNPEDAVTSFDLEMMLPDGSSHTSTFDIGPKTRITFHVDDFPGMSDTNVSVRVHAQGPVVAERAMYFDYNGATGGHVSLGANEPSTQWYFAEGYTGGGFDEYILVLNPNPQDAVVTLDFMKPDGSVYSQDFPARAGSRITINVDAAPDMGDTDVSVRLTSTLPVVAERAMYFGYAECPGGHVQAGCTDPGILRFFAEGYTSRFFDTYLLVMNPNDYDLPVVVTFCRPDGSTVGQPMMVGPHSRATLKVNLVPNLSNSEFSIRVDTGGPAVVERAMYFSYPR
ncbi:MAG: L,D-transpeptidase [Actinobacteria bacterium]|nr:L,D-transpeptidase [Actinomycetota bacterium]